MTQEAVTPVPTAAVPASPLREPDAAVPGGDEPREVRLPPETGDPVIDAALQDLADAPVADLDAQLAAGEAVHRTLQSRLTDLGG